MEKFTQKYTIVQLLEDLPDGAEYDRADWPLHVTLADVFATNWSEDQLVKHLEEFCTTQKTLSTHAEKEAHFGPNGETHVVILKLNDELYELHASLVDFLAEGNAVFNTPEYTKKGFVPHSTVQSKKRLALGDKVNFTSLSVIDMFPNNDPYRRRVIKTVSFKMPIIQS